MALDYGFAKCKVASEPKLRGTRKDGETQFHLLVDLDVASETWQAAINVGTDNSEDGLKYRLVFDFHHPIRTTLAGLDAGFQDLTGQSALPALDFLRSDILAGTGSWRDTDPIDGSEESEPIPTLKRLLETARQQQADTYVFGRTFTSGLGLHDIHMNQGSTGSFLNDGVDDHNDHNDIWRDGAILVDLGDQKWAGYFTAFTQQLVPTDGLGNPTEGAHPMGNSDPGSQAGK